MEDISFLNTLKMKYNYSDKLITALDKIIPKLIVFYGHEYEAIIKKAISTTRIIECTPMQPISSILPVLKLTKQNKEKALIKENLKTSPSIYIADPVIIYDELLNSYIIKDVKRYIILAHFHNLDSPRGLATLTHELSKLIRSYQNEFKISSDILIEKTGLKISTKKILKDQDDITLDLEKEQNVGLEIGVNSYEEEQITSLVINDKYETFDTKIPKKVAFILYERLGLKQDIIKQSLTGTNEFQERYNIKPDLLKELSELVDDTVKQEEQNSDINITKEEKNQIEEELNKINRQIGDNIIFYINANRIINDERKYKNKENI